MLPSSCTRLIGLPSSTCLSNALLKLSVMVLALVASCGREFRKTKDVNLERGGEREHVWRPSSFLAWAGSLILCLFSCLPGQHVLESRESLCTAVQRGTAQQQPTEE